MTCLAQFNVVYIFKPVLKVLKNVFVQSYPGSPNLPIESSMAWPDNWHGCIDSKSF